MERAIERDALMEQILTPVILSTFNEGGFTKTEVDRISEEIKEPLMCFVERELGVNLSDGIEPERMTAEEAESMALKLALVTNIYIPIVIEKVLGEALDISIDYKEQCKQIASDFSEFLADKDRKKKQKTGAEKEIARQEGIKKRAEAHSKQDTGSFAMLITTKENRLDCDIISNCGRPEKIEKLHNVTAEICNVEGSADIEKIIRVCEQKGDIQLTRIADVYHKRTIPELEKLYEYLMAKAYQNLWDGYAHNMKGYEFSITLHEMTQPPALYSDVKTARRMINKAMEYFDRITHICTNTKTNDSILYDKLIKIESIVNGVVTIKLGKQYDWENRFKYYTSAPSYIYKLNHTAFKLQVAITNLVGLRRQREEIEKKGFFKIGLENAADRLGLTEKKSFTEDITRPIDSAIAEIKKFSKNQDYIIKLVIPNSGHKTDILKKGYIKVTPKGAMLDKLYEKSAAHSKAKTKAIKAIKKNGSKKPQGKTPPITVHEEMTAAEQGF